MPEKLLTSLQVAERLSLSLRHFYRLEPYLIAKWGLERAIIGRSKRYTEISVDRLIRKAVKEEIKI